MADCGHIRCEPYRECQLGEVTEYGVLMSGGGYRLLDDSPEVERVAPLAARIGAEIRGNGNHVFRRRVIVIEDWAEVTGPDVTA